MAVAGPGDKHRDFRRASGGGERSFSSRQFRACRRGGGLECGQRASPTLLEILPAQRRRRDIFVETQPQINSPAPSGRHIQFVHPLMPLLRSLEIVFVRDATKIPHLRRCPKFRHPAVGRASDDRGASGGIAGQRPRAGTAPPEFPRNQANARGGPHRFGCPSVRRGTKVSARLRPSRSCSTVSLSATVPRSSMALGTPCRAARVNHL